jgi:hypothetical protein
VAGRFRPAWPFFGFAAFTAFMLFPQLLRMDSVLDLGDPLFSIWRIGWVYRQLLGDPRALFDANIFHPEPLTFAYSASMLLPALAAAPLLAAGVHPVVTYNILLVGSFYLSAVATYFLVRELTDSRPAAFVAGLIFAFYPFRFEHYTRAGQVQSARGAQPRDPRGLWDAAVAPARRPTPGQSDDRYSGPRDRHRSPLHTCASACVAAAPAAVRVASGGCGSRGAAGAW